jgi:8-oxo-dGTP pyrophosphatase MutT (NUDIX family)
VARTRIEFCSRCGSKTELRVVSDLERSVCTACGFVHYVNPMPGVSILIPDGGRALLVRRGPGHSFPGLWCMPCGAIEHAEDFLTAGIREVREETGLDIEIASLLSVCTNYFEGGTTTLVPVLEGRVLGGSPRPDGDETIDIRWFAPDELPALAFEADGHIIQRYFATGLIGAPVDPLFARRSLV